jgi:hypothetical protein
VRGKEEVECARGLDGVEHALEHVANLFRHEVDRKDPRGLGVAAELRGERVTEPSPHTQMPARVELRGLRGRVDGEDGEALHGRDVVCEVVVMERIEECNEHGGDDVEVFAARRGGENEGVVGEPGEGSGAGEA